MPLQADIQNKEKSLAELMAKILQAPLEPLDRSIKEISGELLEAHDRLRTLDEAVVPLLGTLAGNVERSGRHAKSALAQIQEELPRIERQMKEHVTAAAADQRSALALRIDDVARETQNSLKLHSEALLAVHSRADAAQSEAVQAMAAAAREQAAGIQQAIASGTGALHAAILDLRSMQATTDGQVASLALRIQTTESALLARLDQHGVEQRQSGTQALQAVQAVTSRQAAAGRLIDEQHAALKAQVEACQKTLNRLSMVTVLSLMSTVACFGFLILQR
jgi:hypothetical protein